MGFDAFRSPPSGEKIGTQSSTDNQTISPKKKQIEATRQRLTGSDHDSFKVC